MTNTFIQKWEIDTLGPKYDTLCWGSNGVFVGPTTIVNKSSVPHSTEFQVFDCSTKALDVIGTGRIRHAIDFAMAPEAPRYGGSRKRRSITRRKRNKRTRRMSSRKN